MKPEELSFVGMVVFRFGVGTDKSMSATWYKDMKDRGGFVGKPPKKVITKMFDSDFGCTEHAYEVHLTLDALRRTLFDYIFPEECCPSAFITFRFGACDCYNFNGQWEDKLFCERTQNAATLQALKLYKQLTGESAWYINEKSPYRCQCIEAMAGLIDCTAAVVPVYFDTNQDQWVVHEKYCDLIEESELMSDPSEENFCEVFDLDMPMSLSEIERKVDELYASIYNKSSRTGSV